MAGSLSVDLRRSVVGVIEGGLLSCRATAQRFSVSAPSTSRWRAQERREGISATPQARRFVEVAFDARILDIAVAGGWPLGPFGRR